MSEKPLVSIVMGSMSDWDTMQHCASMLDKFGVPYEKNVASAHRTPEKACIVADALTECFPHAHVAVESDLSGAARALCGHTKGIACILGTGSNSCEYDGEKIVSNVSPLGYILGDEGSGAVLNHVMPFRLSPVWTSLDQSRRSAGSNPLAPVIKSLL